MIFLSSSVVTDFLVTRDDLVISVDFVKVMHSRHSHQLPPKFCGRQWRVMRAIEGEKFFLSCLWHLGFCSEFNAWWRRSTQCGHVARADWGRWWHDPWVSHYFSVSLDFWLQTFLFLYFHFCSEYYLSRLFLRSLQLCSGDSDLAPATLLSEFFWLQPFCSSRYVTFLFPFCSLSLITFLWVLDFSFALCFCCFCVWFLGF